MSMRDGDYERFKVPVQVQYNLAENRGWFIGLGIALTALGIIVLGSAMIASIFTVNLLGFFLLLGGLVQVVHAFWVRNWPGFIMGLLTGVFLIIAGTYMISNPVISLAALTFLLVVFLIASGIVKTIFALSNTFDNRWMLVVSGVVSILLGILIWQGWPVSSLYILGIFLGIDLLMMGITWLVIGFAAGHMGRSHRHEAF